MTQPSRAGAARHHPDAPRAPLPAGTGHPRPGRTPHPRRQAIFLRIGDDHPVLVDMVVEIPAGSRNKYEMDHDSGRIRLDRTLFTATAYPADYGFIPDTLAEDGDPLDAIVLLDAPTFPGCTVTVRPVGVFWMSDEHGPDAKLLCVPGRDPRWKGTVEIADVPGHVLNEIGHFFNVYKDIEPGKHTDVRGWQDRAEADRVLAEARQRYREPAP